MIPVIGKGKVDHVHDDGARPLYGMGMGIDEAR
jgi:hypothetical protein